MKIICKFQKKNPISRKNLKIKYTFYDFYQRGKILLS